MNDWKNLSLFDHLSLITLFLSFFINKWLYSYCYFYFYNLPSSDFKGCFSLWIFEIHIFSMPLVKARETCRTTRYTMYMCMRNALIDNALPFHIYGKAGCGYRDVMYKWDDTMTTRRRWRSCSFLVSQYVIGVCEGHKTRSTGSCYVTSLFLFFSLFGCNFILDAFDDNKGYLPFSFILFFSTGGTRAFTLEQ